MTVHAVAPLDNQRSVNLETRAACLAQDDGHWLAGFAEAEGSFIIAPNNDGRTRTCYFSLSQRDDDRELIAALQDQTGLGVVRPRRAVGGARPQVTWTISRKHHCLELVNLFRRFPMRGRKAAEFEIWAEAVAEWTQPASHNPRRWRSMELLQLRLREQRQYFEPNAETKPTGNPLPGAYIGGFVTGEGCLTLPRSGHPRFEVKVRRDDARLMASLQRTSGLGYVTTGPASGRSKPTSSWRVLRHQELAELCRFLSGTLKGRKAREMAEWSRAAIEYRDAAIQGRPRDSACLDAARVSFLEARKYRPPTDRGVRRIAPDRRQNAINSLVRWAADEPGALSCTAYERWRSGSLQAPTRNTIAIIFGSWAEALKAAGFADRQARAGRARTPP